MWLEVVKMRRIFIVVVISIVSFFTLYFKESENYFTEIEYDEIDYLLATQDKFILIIGRDKCPFCIDLIQDVKSDIKKEKEFVYYYKMNQGDMETKQAIIEKFGEFDYLPHILYIKDGRILKIRKSEEGIDIYDAFWNGFDG